MRDKQAAKRLRAKGEKEEWIEKREDAANVHDLQITDFCKFKFFDFVIISLTNFFVNRVKNARLEG